MDININLIRLLGVGALALIVTACGGGGGSGGSKSPEGSNNFSLSFAPEVISGKCYEHEPCSVDIRATYHGTSPTGTIYVIATLDDKVEFYYALYDTYADLHFSTPYSTPKGNYKGNVTIDICADRTCSKRYGSRYTLPYTWTVMSSWPTFIYGVAGTTDRTFTNNEMWLSGKFDAEPTTYELVIDMPGEATNVGFPQEFIDRYHVEPVNANTFKFTPSYETPSGSEAYTFSFVGPNNYAKSFEITINHNFIVQGASPLPNQVIYAQFSENSIGGTPRDVIVGNYANGLCGDTSLKTSLAMLTGTEWLTYSGKQGCYLELQIDPTKNNYGIYDGTVTVTSNNTDQQVLPVVIAYSKNSPTVITQAITIFPDTTPETLQTNKWFNIQGAEDTFEVSAVSPWIMGLNLTYNENGNQQYDYTVNVDEIKKINPLNTGSSWMGVVKINNTNPNGNFGLALIDLTIDVPHIFSIETKTAPANATFTEKIYGESLFDFKGVEIVHLDLDSNGDYTKVISNTYYYPSYQADYQNSTLVLNMPALGAGMYQLKFSGVFSHHFPTFMLEVK